jgi:hypothetical protein
MVGLGGFGLISLAGFMSVAGTSAGLIGLIERCAVYPILIGLILAGKSVWDSPSRRSASAGVPTNAVVARP